ncbi:MAG: hypothetical protein K8I03_03160 [Ignavibacteria bacterium]|nr:hypothetical protein [Ignavibacteria bacterium]
MKKTLFFLFLFNSALLSQSPFYSIKFNVNPSPFAPENASYSVSWQSCEFDYDPVIPSGNYWFGNDTSALSWSNLPDSFYGKVTCSNPDTGYSQAFEVSNQAMMWEKFLKFTITKTYPENGSSSTMIIVFPVLIRAFVTYIDLGQFFFNEGYFELTDDIVYKIDDKKHVHLSLPKNYSWKKIDIEKRKIKL